MISYWSYTIGYAAMISFEKVLKSCKFYGGEKMNKKIIVIGILVGALALGGIFATAFAGTRAPKATANSAAETRVGNGSGMFYGRFDRGNNGQFDMKGGPGAEHRGEMAEALAKYLGISEDALRNEIMSGKTLAEIAQEHGKSTTDLVNFFMGEVKEHLQKALQDGRITQQRYDEILKNAQQRIQEMINGKMPFGRFGMRGQSGERPFFGRMHNGCHGGRMYNGEHAGQNP